MLSPPAEINGRRGQTRSFSSCPSGDGPGSGLAAAGPGGGPHPTLRLEPGRSGRARALGRQALCRSGAGVSRVVPGKRPDKGKKNKTKTAMRFCAEDWRMFANPELPARRGAWMTRGQSNEFCRQPSSGKPHLLFPPLQPSSSPQNPRPPCGGRRRVV